MAKLECELQGDFSLILSQLEDEIINGSISASLEEKSDFCFGSAYCATKHTKSEHYCTDCTRDTALREETGSA